MYRKNMYRRIPTGNFRGNPERQAQMEKLKKYFPPLLMLIIFEKVAIPVLTCTSAFGIAATPLSIGIGAAVALWCAFDAYRDYVKISSAKSAAVSA